MTSSLSYGPFTPDDAGPVSEIGSWAFGGAPADILPWFDKIGRDNLRVVKENGRPVGHLGIVWMGQWFGGRAVKMAGIAAVGVAADRRGHGAASFLMRETLAEIRSAGYPLSALYPATQPVYRSVGYEQAGSRYEIRLPAPGLAHRDRGLAVEPVDLDSETDRELIAAAYRARARLTSGNLDRNGYIWSRIYKPRGDPPRAFKVVSGGGVEGYVFMTKQPRDPPWSDLPLLDLVALTPEAGLRLLTLFADHRSLAQDIIWHGTPHDPLLMLLREQPAAARLRIHWMLRIVDVPGALAARGWPAGLAGELHLSVADDLFSDNSGDFILGVSGGKGNVGRGGAGRFRTHIRGLASLYSGFFTPRQLRAAGLLEAPEEDLNLAQALFAGPAPWMPDMF